MGSQLQFWPGPEVVIVTVPAPGGIPKRVHMSQQPITVTALSFGGSNWPLQLQNCASFRNYLETCRFPWHG